MHANCTVLRNFQVVLPAPNELVLAEVSAIRGFLALIADQADFLASGGDEAGAQIILEYAASADQRAGQLEGWLQMSLARLKAAEASAST